MAKVEQFYDSNVQREWDRLGRHKTEFAITMRALSEYLPRPPARIVDIGGGPGRYSIALAQMGYDVTLVDLSAMELDLAGGKAAEAGVRLAGYVHANALDLIDLPGQPYDAALLMGPLYHLLDLQERRTAVAQAKSVLRPGALLFAAFITRYAGIRWSARYLPSWIIERADDVERLLDTGINMPPAEGGFTDSYFAHPSEIKPLMEEGGFRTLDLLACEGVISMIEDEINLLEGEDWSAWVDMNYRLCRDPSIHGAAEHLLYVGSRVAIGEQGE